MAAERDAVPALPLGRGTGHTAFAEAVRAALAGAAQQGWRELVLSDASFADWPLGERAAVNALQSWAQAGGRCLMLAARYDVVLREHARLVAWRQTWGHLIECRVWRGRDDADFPGMLWSAGWALRRIDVERQVFVCEEAPEHLLAWREDFDERWRAGTPGFPATQLGL